MNSAELASKLNGLVTVIPTPLNHDESLDVEGMASMAEYTLRYPFAAIWALATAGEDQNLPDAVIDECAQSFVNHFGASIPVLVKTSRPGTRETIERTKRMADFGIDGAIIHFEHKRLADDNVRRHFEAIADASPVPVLIYHNLTRGAHLSVDLLVELSRHPNIAGMKAGGRDLSELQRTCLEADDGFAVMTAGGGQTLAGLCMGASAHLAIPLMAFPERAFALLDHVRAGRLAEARAQQKIITAFLKGMPKLGNREVTGEVKCVLEIRGVIKRHVSAPFIEATASQKAQMTKLIEELDLFMTKYPTEQTLE